MPVTLGRTNSYQVFVLPRNGEAVALINLPFTKVTWERVANQPSEATVELGGLTGQWDEAVCEIVAALDTWAFELGVYRNNHRVWAGPITAINDTDQGSTVTAKDVSAWLGERNIHFTHIWTNAEAGEVFSSIVEDAMSVDFEPGILVSWKANGVLTTRTVKATSYRNALAEIGDLTTAGINWSTVDRTIQIRDYDIRHNPVASFGNKHFIGRPNVNISGPVGTRWTVRGTPDPEHPKNKTAVGTLMSLVNENRWGVHEKAVVDTKVKTDYEARKAALINLGLMGQPSVMFSGGTLHSSAPVTVDALLPGVLVDLSLSQTCRPVTGRYRLTRVIGTHDSKTSTIDIEVEPVGQLASQSDI